MNNHQWLVFVICVIFYMVVCVAVALRLVWLWIEDVRTLLEKFQSQKILPGLVRFSGPDHEADEVRSLRNSTEGRITTVATPCIRTNLN